MSTYSLRKNASRGFPLPSWTHTWAWRARHCSLSVHLGLRKPPQHIQTSEITPAPSVRPRTHACCRKKMNLSAAPRARAGRAALWDTAEEIKDEKEKRVNQWPASKTKGIMWQGKREAHYSSDFIRTQTYLQCHNVVAGTHARTHAHDGVKHVHSKC